MCAFSYLPLSSPLLPFEALKSSLLQHCATVERPIPFSRPSIPTIYLILPLPSELLQFKPSQRRINQCSPSKANVVSHLPSCQSALHHQRQSTKLTSAPYSPTCAAIGPIYQTCAMQRIAPAQPTKNAMSAAMPTGSFSF